MGEFTSAEGLKTFYLCIGNRQINNILRENSRVMLATNHEHRERRSLYEGQ